MLTIEDIRSKVNSFPTDKPVEDLIDEIILLYKIEKGVQEAEAGKGIKWDTFQRQMEAWWKSK